MFGKEEKSYMKIFKDFRNGIFYEDLYKKYDITQDGLIKILNSNIKGNYDYKRILSGGIASQKQFLHHLNNRWNPLIPEAPYVNISPYFDDKEREEEDV